MATKVKRKPATKKSAKGPRPARMNKSELIEPSGHGTTTTTTHAPTSKTGVKFKPGKLM